MYAKGTKTDVTRVKLMLNINNKQTASRDTKELGRLCEKMVKNLLGSTPAGLGTKIAAGVPFEMVYESYNLFLKKDVWPTGKGYELNCFITTLDHKE